LKLGCGLAGAVLDDGAKKDHHSARRLLVDDLIHLRIVFPERHAVGAVDLRMRRGSRAGRRWKDGVGSDLLWSVISTAPMAMGR